MWARSPAGYREFKSISPLLLPSERTYQRAKKENKSRDGAQCVQVYLSNQLSRCGENVHGYLIFDEMKLKGGVIFNSQTGEAVGMADDMLDLKSVLKRLFSDGGQEFKGAEKVNQWMYMTLGPNRRSFACGYFFNDGKLSGDTMLRQFDHVVTCCESTGAHVVGVTCDLGGPNGRFMQRLRDNKKFDETDCWQFHLSTHRLLP